MKKLISECIITHSGDKQLTQSSWTGWLVMLMYLFTIISGDFGMKGEKGLPGPPGLRVSVCTTELDNGENS